MCFLEIKASYNNVIWGMTELEKVIQIIKLIRRQYDKQNALVSQKEIGLCIVQNNGFSFVQYRNVTIFVGIVCFYPLCREI